MIRKAVAADASRIAEISIFTKRMNYRTIFHNDQVSFGEMQVYPLAKQFLDDPEKLSGFWVFDDGFVKAYIHLDGSQIVELYVDPFFENQGIGSKLIEFAIHQFDADTLWVLKKNQSARRFYERHGFSESGQRQLEEGTDQYIIEMKRKARSEAQA